MRRFPGETPPSHLKSCTQCLYDGVTEDKDEGWKFTQPWHERGYCRRCQAHWKGAEKYGPTVEGEYLRFLRGVRRGG